MKKWLALVAWSVVYIVVFLSMLLGFLTFFLLLIMFRYDRIAELGGSQL